MPEQNSQNYKNSFSAKNRQCSCQYSTRVEVTRFHVTNGRGTREYENKADLRTQKTVENVDLTIKMGTALLEATRALHVDARTIDSKTQGKNGQAATDK